MRDNRKTINVLVLNGQGLFLLGAKRIPSFRLTSEDGMVGGVTMCDGVLDFSGVARFRKRAWAAINHLSDTSSPRTKILVGYNVEEHAIGLILGEITKEESEMLTESENLTENGKWSVFGYAPCDEQTREVAISNVFMSYASEMCESACRAVPFVIKKISPNIFLLSLS